ncbi:MAG: alpha/beta fold hydrolase [Ruegeria sp.]
MKHLKFGLTLLVSLCFLSAPLWAWRSLSAPFALPEPASSGEVETEGARIHYMTFGDTEGLPVLLLHGGLGAAEDFGSQIPALSGQYRLIAIDSRGHGRSTDDDQPYSYTLMARDVLAVMDALSLDKAAIVGWSDGGNIGLELAITAPERLIGVFAIGANYDVSGVKPSAGGDGLVGQYVGYAVAQYGAISPTPDNFGPFSEKVFAMWGSQPSFSEDQLRGIATRFIVAAGIYEEAIDEAHTRRMAELIPNAELLLIENASHFAQWQQPEVVNAAILDFLGSLSAD